MKMIKAEFHMMARRVPFEKTYENEDDLLLDLDLPYIKIYGYIAGKFHMLPTKCIDLVKVEAFET
jgi:hypothetical protein